MIHKLDFYSSDDNSSGSEEDSRPFKLAEPSLSSAPHELVGQTLEETITVACIVDCPTITVHASKLYKALIDSGAAISLLQIFNKSAYLDDCFKTPIQPTTAKLNTADGSLMTALGMTELHLRIAEFKFTHNFIICDTLPDTEIILAINIQKKFSIPYAWDKS